MIPSGRAVFGAGFGFVLWAALTVAWAAPSPIQVSFSSANVQAFPELDIRLELQDSKGRPFQGVGSREVEVFDGGEPVSMFRFRPVRGSAEALSVILVTDISGSMKGEPLEAARRAAVAFTGRLDGADSVGVVAFNQEVGKVLAPTREHEKVRKAIRGFEAGGDTALYDALRRGVELLQRAGNRQGIILLSDGKENSSKTRPALVRALLRERGIPVYCIGLGAEADIAELQQLASTSGGQFFRASQPRDLMGIYQRIAGALVSQYRLQLRSPARADGSVRSLRLVIKTPRGGGSGQFSYLATQTTGYRASASADRLRKAWNRVALGTAWTGAAVGTLLFLAAALPLRSFGLLRTRRRFASLWLMALCVGLLVGLWVWSGASPEDEFLLRLNLGEGP